jgi:hypothetical protein
VRTRLAQFQPCRHSWRTRSRSCRRSIDWPSWAIERVFRGFTGIILEPPDEAGRSFRQRIDALQRGNESGELRGFQWRAQVGHVHLRQLFEIFWGSVVGIDDFSLNVP